MDFVYRFPVVKGVQAKREYYIAMLPLKMIPKLFPQEDEYVLPEHRAQRKLNAARIPVISKYILENRETYVFSALAASIDGQFRFCPSEHPDVGVLEISMDAKLLINDGQHRKAAILDAISEDESLLNETISVVFFEDQGLARSQQMFTDLNKHAVKTSNSIAELYDSRDQLAVVTRTVISKIKFLNAYTDKEKDILYAACSAGNTPPVMSVDLAAQRRNAGIMGPAHNVTDYYPKKVEPTPSPEGARRYEGGSLTNIQEAFLAKDVLHVRIWPELRHDQENSAVIGLYWVDKNTIRGVCGKDAPKYGFEIQYAQVVHVTPLDSMTEAVREEYLTNSIPENKD